MYIYIKITFVLLICIKHTTDIIVIPNFFFFICGVIIKHYLNMKKIKDLDLIHMAIKFTYMVLDSDGNFVGFTARTFTRCSINHAIDVSAAYCAINNWIFIDYQIL